MKRIVSSALFLLITLVSFGQYPPPAGEPGSTALYKDTTLFRFWASDCSVERGFVNIVDTTVVFNNNNHASYGVPEDAEGLPDELAVSLGDGGVATLSFQVLICNNPGPDFAVFENSFANNFLELAFVEVSSDGNRFVRFPSVSLTQDTTQVATFGTVDATQIHNLAGKYRVFYGTPFDLDDVGDSVGLDVNKITYIRIIDAVGCIQPGFMTFDSQGHIINEPWPTPFHSGGFDLDAVGVINSPQAIHSPDDPLFVSIFPNPCVADLNIRINNGRHTGLDVLDARGKVIIQIELKSPGTKLDLSAWFPGVYFFRFESDEGAPVVRKVVKL